MTAIHRLFVLTTSLVLITSCAGIDDAIDETGLAGDIGELKIGQFWDSPVSGLEFETATQKGVTGANGAFQYRAGEKVTFKLGNTVLGSAKGSSRISPFDLVSIPVPELGDLSGEVFKMFIDNGVTAFEHGVNILIFLQTLDSDNNPDNGIEIPPAVALFFLTIVEGILLEQDNDAFVIAFLALFTQLVTEGMLERGNDPQIVDHKDAIEHFYKQLGLNVSL